MDSIIRSICRREGLDGRSIEVLRGGQVNQVYLIDGQYVLRIGQREDAFPRLQRETDLLRRLNGQVPVPRVYAFGEHEGQVYQIQQYVSGEKLYSVWPELSPAAQEGIAAELAGYLQTIHAVTFPQFSQDLSDAGGVTSWKDLLANGLQRSLGEIDALGIRMAPGFVELARGYFEEHKHALDGGTPCLVHGDLSFVNILVDHGRVSAILDFEYAAQAPRDYELWVIEAFCLYPNDYVEEDREVYCTADYAGFMPLLRKHYPALFETDNLRLRANLYHLCAALSSHLAWRKANLSTLPPEQMAAKGFYMARLANFTTPHGIRLFYGPE